MWLGGKLSEKREARNKIYRHACLTNQKWRQWQGTTSPINHIRWWASRKLQMSFEGRSISLIIIVSCSVTDRCNNKVLIFSSTNTTDFFAWFICKVVVLYTGKHNIKKLKSFLTGIKYVWELIYRWLWVEGLSHQILPFSSLLPVYLFYFSSCLYSLISFLSLFSHFFSYLPSFFPASYCCVTLLFAHSSPFFIWMPLKCLPVLLHDNSGEKEDNGLHRIAGQLSLKPLINEQEVLPFSEVFATGQWNCLLGKTVQFSPFLALETCPASPVHFLDWPLVPFSQSFMGISVFSDCHTALKSPRLPQKLWQWTVNYCFKA